MPFVGISLLIQIGLVVHVIQTGRDRQWIFILLIPVVGPAAYIITQLLPDVFSSSSARQTQRRLVQAIDPQRELRQRKEDLERADTIDNRRRLAEECVEAGFHDEAISLYGSCLVGFYEDDAAILRGLAEALFSTGDYEECKNTLDRMLQANPEVASQTGHLLYARCLEELEQYDDAQSQYAELVAYASGEEARVRYALFLQGRGRTEEADVLFEESIKRGRLGGRAYRRIQKTWLDIAGQNLTR